MSKYKDVFNARKIENESSGNNENQKVVNVEIQKNMEIQKDGKPEESSKGSDKLVNLGIKVSESRRRFWVGQAKLQGITISKIITDALSKKFGEPK